MKDVRYSVGIISVYNLKECKCFGQNKFIILDTKELLFVGSSNDEYTQWRFWNIFDVLIIIFVTFYWNKKYSRNDIHLCSYDGVYEH